MNAKILTIFSLILFACSISSAQVSIDLPINNAVFQRNSSDQAKIYIAGGYLNPIITSVQARLVTPNTSNPISGFDWTIIDSTPSKGKYYGFLNNVPKGWYTLEVRLVNTGNVLTSSSVSRVGVGDVYLISGQSNAVGWLGVPVPTEFSEKNITQNAYQSCGATYPSFATLSSITSNHKISITGESSWAYGRLGQRLADNLNIPVAFYNGGAGGSSIENWVSSSNGNGTIHPFNGQQFCQGFPNAIGSPYNIFNKVLKYYPSLFGIRAIIWHQGESDNYLNTSSASYTNQLTTFINKTRTDFGATIPWMVSRASYYLGSTDANVILGQDNVISAVNQVFAGPTTDDYIAPGDRYDTVHFDTQGLYKFANGLFDYITGTGFLSSSVPVEPNLVPLVQINVNGNSVALSVPSGYASYKWVAGNDFNGSSLNSTNSYVASSGTYRCYMTDGNLNVIMSQAINVTNILTQQNISTTFTDSLFLSNYVPYTIQNGLGPISFDKSVGDTADGDGSPMLINSVPLSKGIGVHSGSEIVYKMPTGFHSRFKATIGVDDAVSSNASVTFQVFGNGTTLLYTSPVLTHLANAVNIDINIAGYSNVKLVVNNSGGVLASNQADWGNARVIFSKPENIILSKIYRKCLELSWTAANDLNGITSYQVFKNDVLQTTLPAGTLSYAFNGLTQSTSYKLSVKGIDANGYETAKVDTIVSTVAASILYSPTNQLCIGDNTVPESSISGGSYKLVSKPDSVAFSLINSSTGEALFGSDGFVLMRYVWGFGTACADSASFYIGGIDKPSPPIVNLSTTSLINVGESATLTASSCSGSYTLEWFDQSTSGTYNSVPVDTSSYYAFCKNSSCYSVSSNVVTVKVIPNCPPTFNLNSPTSDLNYGSKIFNFKSTQTIKASNKLYSPTGALMKAGSSIELKPGFSVESGSVFSATIGTCP